MKVSSKTYREQDKHQGQQTLRLMTFSRIVPYLHAKREKKAINIYALTA